MQATQAQAKLAGNPNKYPADCESCGCRVESKGGRYWRRGPDDAADGSEYVVWCESCLRGVATPATVLTDRKVDPGGSVGDFVLSGQEQTDDFRHVSKIWQDQCQTFDAGLQAAARAADQVQDLRVPLNHWRPIVDGRDVALQYTAGGRYGHLDGATFKPTGWALKKLFTGGGLSENFAKVATRDDRGPEDAQILVDALQRFLFNQDRTEQLRKDYLFRTRKDGTFRAILSDQYAIVDNEWYLKLLAKAVPGGLLSHFRGDGDTMRFNVLVPDTIRENPDSDYGGGVACGNSEIGQSSIYSHPFSFRAICMNGCIWDAQTGNRSSHVHRGRIDLESLGKELTENITAQLAIAETAAGRWSQLHTRKLPVAVDNVLAAVGKLSGLSNPELRSVSEAYNVEPETNARGIVNAVTRAAQEGNKADRAFRFDNIGGRLMMFGDNEWTQLFESAKGYTDKAIAKMFAVSA